MVCKCGGTCTHQLICPSCVVQDRSFTSNGDVRCAHCRQVYRPSWVNDHAEALRKMNELLRAGQSTELRDVIPVMFAQPGDHFMHRFEDAYLDSDIFEYQGRTTDNWLIFRHVEGDGFHIVNGGVRDIIGAWPMETYAIPDDPFLIKLPPDLCYMFRVEEHSYRR